MTQDVAARIGALEWWHTIDIAPGVVTPGSWELRPAAGRMPWPGGGDFRNLRCLDIGTMDGFWAFEMERRGAADVVASDLHARPTFALAAELLSDPIGAFHAIRRVCRGNVIVLDQVSLPLSLFPRPLARVAARPGYQEWFMFNRRGFARALEEAGFAVEASSGFLRDRPGPGVNRRDFPWSMRLRHAAGLEGISMALRGRPRHPG